MDKVKFYVEYLDGDDEGLYIESAVFESEGIEEALDYAENKFGSIIMVKNLDYYNSVDK